MATTICIALLGTGLAAFPLLFVRGRLLGNPALFMFLLVAWSLLFESVYIAVLHPRPAAAGHDLMYVDAASADFFLAGARLLLAAVCGYVLGFFLAGRRTLGGLLPRLGPPPGPPPRRVPRLVALLAFALVCFTGYLVLSDSSLVQGPWSAKRFRPQDIGVSSRFLYGPYYLFKLAMLSGSSAYATALLLFSSGRSGEKRVAKLLFAALFLVALGLSHFASLRLFILLLLFQVLLLLFYLDRTRDLPFIGAFAMLTVASLAWISLLQRAPQVPDREAVIEAPAGAEAQDQRHEGLVLEGTQAGSASTPASVDGRGTGAAGPSSRRRVRRVLGAVFEGRYFIDVAKMAQFAHHFPAVAPFFKGEGFLGRAPASRPDVDPTDGTFNRYLSRTLFKEPNNSIPPGFAGELYINFGIPGLVLGFLALGTFHRLVFNQLSVPTLAVPVAGALIALIPSTTLVLLNSGVLSAVSRSILDLGVVFLVWLPFRFSRPRRTEGRGSRYRGVRES